MRFPLILLDDLVLGAILVLAFLLLAPGLAVWAVLALLLWLGVKAWIFRSHFARPAVGVEAMEGRVATAMGDLAPRGHVDLDGELWQAELVEAGAARAGERLVVRAVEGLTLKVAPVGVIGGTVLGPKPRSILLDLAHAMRRAPR